MTQHFNIGQKTEVNPFEHVQWVKIAEGALLHQSSFNRMLQRAETVETRFMGDRWTILFDIKLLDFLTVINWYSVTRGYFLFKNNKIQFDINDDVMTCW